MSRLFGTPPPRETAEPPREDVYGRDATGEQDAYAVHTNTSGDTHTPGAPPPFPQSPHDDDAVRDMADPHDLSKGEADPHGAPRNPAGPPDVTGLQHNSGPGLRGSR